MYFHFDAIPFLRIIIPLSIGIIAYLLISAPILIGIAAFISLLGIIIAIVGIHYSNKFIAFTYLFGICITILLISMGYFLSVIKQHPIYSNHYSHYLNANSFLIKIDEPLIEKEKSFKANIQIIQANFDEPNQNITPVFGSAIAYFKKDSTFKQLKYGDVLLVKNKFTTIESPKNPNQFDYKQYLKTQNIYHQIYLMPSNCITTNINIWHTYYTPIYKLRSFFINKLNKFIPHKTEANVAIALILGYTPQLDKEIMSAYRDTGAMHVLSVSGLHMAIIYSILMFIFGFLDKTGNYGKYTKLITILLFLWIYTILTGLSPSAVRASIMCSFLALGKTTQRNISIYNLLCISAFVILLYNPMLITNVGFQLSYAAMFGIIFLYPKIYNTIFIKNKILDKIWQLTCAAIAAQIITFPLAIYYFGQFPTYFLLSNLLVVELSGVILTIGVAFLISTLIGIFLPLVWLQKYIGLALYCLIFAMNKILQFLQHLPFSKFDALYINSFETIAIYAFILLFITYIVYKNVAYLKYTLITAVIFCASYQQRQLQQQLQKIAFFYAIPKANAMAFIQGKKALIISDSTASTEKNKQFYINENHRKLGIKQTQVINYEQFLGVCDTFIPPALYISPPFIQFYNTVFLINTDTSVSNIYIKNNATNLNYVYNFNNYCCNTTSTFILPEENPSKTHTNLIRQLQQNKNQYFDVYNSALILKWQ